MLQTAQLLPPPWLSTLGFDPARFQTEPPACYRASWQLPGPDSHRQATTSFPSGHDRWTSPPNALGAQNFGLKAASSWPKNLLADPKARIEIGGTAANYLSRPATEHEIAHNMPRLIEMWPAHDSHMEHNGVRHVIVFEPIDAKT